MEWWLAITPTLQDLIIIVFLAFIAAHYKPLGFSEKHKNSQWRSHLIMIVVLGVLAFFSTSRGIMLEYGKCLDNPQDALKKLPDHLAAGQVIISFRNTVVIVAGLVGGKWVGLGVGLIAGINRLSFAGFAAISSCAIGIFLGFIAGYLKDNKPQWIDNYKKMVTFVLLATVIQRIDTFLPYWRDTVELQLKVAVPTLIINLGGCLLFLWIKRRLEYENALEKAERDQRLKVLERDLDNSKLIAKNLQLESEKRQAETRALRALLDPHFLNNSLFSLDSLLPDQPEVAKRYINKLRAIYYFKLNACDSDTISLQQEDKLVRDYCELQNLLMEGKLHATFDIPKNLHDFLLPSFCLINLAENAIKHGFMGWKAPYHLHITVEEQSDKLYLSVRDNGKGIAPERSAQLGKTPVISKNIGGGVALFHMAQRLKLLYDDAAKLTVNNIEPNGALASIILPKKKTL